MLRGKVLKWLNFGLAKEDNRENHLRLWRDAILRITDHARLEGAGMNLDLSATEVRNDYETFVVD